jgi:large subunit ribosomal protein L1
MEDMKLEQAVGELKKGKERKFDQTVELIVNLKRFDVKRNAINMIVNLPNKIKDKKACGFVEKSSNVIDTIPRATFPKYKDKKELKKLVKKYDFFLASAPNMPAVATTFGKVLGPAGKMPSPKLGIIMQENDEEIKKVLEKVNSAVKIHTKEPSVKISIGKASMPEEKVVENIQFVYNAILAELPNHKESIKNVMIKLTMTKPIKVAM